MSGPGDIGGEVSGDEAAWRDLIARFDSPATQTAEAAPWPASEDLPDRGAGDEAARPDRASADRSEADGREPGGHGPGGREAGGSEHSGREADGEPADREASRAAPENGGHDRAGPATDYLPPEGMRIIRFTGDPRAYSPPEEPDEGYVPEPLPPPGSMDAWSKAAWVALICGPGYLLLGTILHWSISGSEALIAIAAFIAGFVTLVVKMGDRPPRDDDDDGAVV
jgi:hypothetical protein